MAEMPNGATGDVAAAKPAVSASASAGQGIVAWLVFCVFSLAILAVAGMSLLLLVQSVATAGHTGISAQYVLGLNSIPMRHAPLPIKQYHILALVKRSGGWHGWAGYVWPQSREMMLLGGISPAHRRMPMVWWRGGLDVLPQLNFFLVCAAGALALAATLLGMLMQLVFRALGYRAVVPAHQPGESIKGGPLLPIQGLVWRHWLVAIFLIGALWLLAMRLESRLWAMQLWGMLPGMLGLLAAAVWAVVMAPLLRPRKAS